MSERIASVLYRARLDLRARWRTLVLLSLLIGAVAGAVVACAAAARRTESAFERLRRTTSAADLYLSSTCPSARCPSGVGEAEARALGEIEGVDFAVPLWLGSGVFEMEDGRFLQEGPDAENEITLVASADPRFGTEIDDNVLVSGRRVAPDAALEVVVDKQLSTSRNIDLGDRILVTLSRRGLDEAEAEDDKGPSTAARTPDFTLEVVGIVLSPLGVRSPTAEYTVSAMFAGPALVKEFAQLGDTGFAVAVERGADASVIDGTRYAELLFVDMVEKAASIDAGTEGDTLMLVVVVLLGALGSLLVLAPVVSRAAINGQADADRLRTLGFTRRDLVARAAVHGVALGASSVAIAAVTAVALSPIGPIAEARRFEPDHGMNVDLGVVLAGVVIVAAFAVSVVVVAVWRSTRARPLASRRSSTVARVLGSRRIGPIGSLGLRMSLGGDKAGSDVGYFVAMTLGVAVVTASLTFSGALTRLETTPRLVGMNYDVVTFPADDMPEQQARAAVEAQVEAFLERADVALAGAGTFFPPGSITVGHDAVETWLITFQPGPRAVEPVVLRGRAPAAAHELLVHPDLLDRLGEIGDTIAVSADFELDVGADAGTGVSHVTNEYTIVGAGVSTVDSQLKATSAMTYDGLLRLYGVAYADEPFLQVIRATFRDGADHAAALAGLDEAGLLRGLTITATDGTASEEGNRIIANPARDLARLDLDGLDRVPTVLAVLLGGLATCVLAIMITDKTRTWRSRLAIRRALGETSWQLAAGVVTATILTTLGAVIAGLPVGIVAGRELWLRHAERLGVVPEALVPWTSLGMMTTGAVLIACVRRALSRVVERTATHRTAAESRVNQRRFS